jgi:hypothetical protein
MAQGVEYPPSKLLRLSSNPSTTKKTPKQMKKKPAVRSFPAGLTTPLQPLTALWQSWYILCNHWAFVSLNFSSRPPSISTNLSVALSVDEKINLSLLLLVFK